MILTKLKVLLCIFCVFFSIFFFIKRIDTSNTTIRSGLVEKIYLTKNYDIVIRLENDERQYYINRGVESEKIDISFMLDSLPSKNIKIYTTINGHITNLYYNNICFYSD